MVHKTQILWITVFLQVVVKLVAIINAQGAAVDMVTLVHQCRVVRMGMQSMVTMKETCLDWSIVGIGIVS